MRTLEMPDEVFEAAEAEAKQRGISVQDLVVASVRQTLEGSLAPKRGTIDFPVIFTSRNPGTLHLTNEDIRRMEEEDDLRMLGMLD